MTANPRRRWFVYSLRTVFVVVTLLCVWLGWNARVVQQRKAILAEIHRANWWAHERGPQVLGVRGFQKLSHVRRLFGDEPRAELKISDQCDAQLIERAEQAFPESRIFITHHQVDDEFSQNLTIAFRDSLYARQREPNRGTVFKTGLRAEQ